MNNLYQFKFWCNSLFINIVKYLYALLGLKIGG